MVPLNSSRVEKTLQTDGDEEGNSYGSSQVNTLQTDGGENASSDSSRKADLVPVNSSRDLKTLQTDGVEEGDSVGPSQANTLKTDGGVNVNSDSSRKTDILQTDGAVKVNSDGSNKNKSHMLPLKNGTGNILQTGACDVTQIASESHCLGAKNKWKEILSRQKVEVKVLTKARRKRKDD